MKNSLKKKLLFFVLGITFFSCLGLGLATYSYSKKLLVSDTEKYLKEVANVAGKQVKAYVDTEFAMIHAFAKLPNITSEDYTQAEKEAHKDIIEKCAFFIPFYSQYPDKYENVAFYSDQGHFALPSGQVLQLKDKPYIVGPCTTGIDYVDDPRFSTVNNQVLMFLSTAVYNKENKAIGCIVDVIRGNEINTIAEGVQIIDDYHPYIVNTKTKEVLTTLNVSDDRLQEYSEFIVNLSGLNGLTVYKDKIDGIKKIAVSCPVEGYDWAVVCTAPYKAFFNTLLALGRTIESILAIVIVLVCVFSILFVNVVFNPLKKLKTSITDIASGNADLTKRIDANSNDEIGDVVSGFNQFTGKLQSIVAEIKESSLKLGNAGDILREGTVDTSASITQIISNIESVHTQIINQSSSVEDTADSVNKIAENILSLEEMIENQSREVSEASISVEQMINNIQSVNNNVDVMAKSFESLLKSARNGVQIQQDVNKKIENIREQSATLKQANAAIENIAGKTNLLAMNAAIEAAHAGEAGKGFSVVADEIRRLSETSSKQSKTIGDQLNEIQESIDSVVNASAQSSQAFKDVSDKIETTDDLVQEIRVAMNEQKEGSMHINQALHSMNDSTIEVKTASQEMSSGNKIILDEVQKLQNATDMMKQSMEEMSVGATRINQTGSSLNEIVSNMETSIIDIGAQVQQFKV